MSSIWKRNIKLAIFGESHSLAIGGVFDGLPPGINIDLDYIMSEMSRRAPGKSKLTTPREENDIPEILSGYFNGYTTGTPLAFTIHNSNTRSKDYEELKDVMRPSHGDYTGNIRYSGFNDYRGGGHFSGRLTAPLVFMGAIAKLYIKGEKGITITSRVKSIGTISDDELDLSLLKKGELLRSWKGKILPTVSEKAAVEMESLITKAKKCGDSLGGVAQCVCLGVPAGLGTPFFESFESSLASLIFSVPAIKGLEFGKGFDIAKLYGSQANDQMYFEGDRVNTYTNNNGGILGGITNGMPIDFTVAVKPTPSIAKAQKTVNISSGKNEVLTIKGRHDPCILPRVLPVIEACAALVIMDYIVGGGK